MVASREDFRQVDLATAIQLPHPNIDEVADAHVSGCRHPGAQRRARGIEIANVGMSVDHPRHYPASRQVDRLVLRWYPVALPIDSLDPSIPDQYRHPQLRRTALTIDQVGVEQRQRRRLGGGCRREDIQDKY